VLFFTLQLLQSLLRPLPRYCPSLMPSSRHRPLLCLITKDLHGPPPWGLGASFPQTIPFPKKNALLNTVSFFFFLRFSSPFSFPLQYQPLERQGCAPRSQHFPAPTLIPPPSFFFCSCLRLQQPFTERSNVPFMRLSYVLLVRPVLPFLGLVWANSNFLRQTSSSKFRPDFHVPFHACQGPLLHLPTNPSSYNPFPPFRELDFDFHPN